MIRTFLLLLFTPALLGQTVDEILKKHVEALGGREKIQAIETLKMTGAMARGRMGDAPFSRWIKMPDKVRWEVEMRGMTMTQAFDGKQAWGIMPFRGDNEPRVMEGGRGGNIRNQARVFGPLVNPEKGGWKIEFVGKETFEGTDVLKLKLTREPRQREKTSPPPERPSGEQGARGGRSGRGGRAFGSGMGNTMYSYLDAEYFVEIRRVNVRKDREGKEVESSTLFSEYREVAGVMIPHSITTEGGGQRGGRGNRGGGGGGRTMTFDKIEANVPMDDALFTIPAKTETEKSEGNR